VLSAHLRCGLLPVTQVSNDFSSNIASVKRGDRLKIIDVTINFRLFY